jgi:hypothetical protein
VGVLAYAIQQVVSLVGLLVLFRVMGHNCLFTLCPLYLLYFNFVRTTLNHLFIWLILKLLPMTPYCDEGGLFNFLLIARAFFWVDGIYIDITRQNCRAQDEANDNV